MAGVVLLNNFFDSVEIEGLSEIIKEKIENLLSKQKSESDELKAKLEKTRVNAEQRYFDIEKQLISSNAKLEAESTSSGEMKKQIKDLEKKYHEASTKLKEIEETQSSSLSSQLHLNKANEQLEAEKRELAVLLEKKQRDLDLASDEVRTLFNKLTAANNEKNEAIVKLGEIRSKEDAFEIQSQRFAQQKERLQKEIDTLNNELSEKLRELGSIHREKASELLSLQSQLEQKTDECKYLQDQVENLKKTNSEQVTRIDSLIEKLKSARDSSTQSEEQFRHELVAQKKLIALYKNSSEEAHSKVIELTGAVDELQQLIKEASDAQTQLEERKNTEIRELQDVIRQKEEQNRRLEQELVNANELLEAMKVKGMSEEKVESMFPTAATTSKMLKSGMSLTQIYNEYVQATDTLLLEKEENKRLNHYLDQILQEIEEKAPILKKQRDDYETALQTIEQMTRQLDDARLECQNLRGEADENYRKANYLVRENKKLQQQCQDLANQVKYLVREIEELQGGRRVKGEAAVIEVTSSSEVISGKLVTFGNLDELQEQNQKLLSALRELSEKQEEDERTAIDSKTRELKEQLDTALQELEELKEARGRQAELVESIVRQRDMYRVLLQQGDSVSPLSPALTSTPFPANKSRSPATLGLESSPESGKKLEETLAALKQLQAEFVMYKKEKAENEKIENEQMEKCKEELSNLRVQNAKLSSQLEFANEQKKVLQSNAESYRKEIALLREKSQKYSNSVAKHEQTINTLREDLMVTQEKLARAEARVQNLSVEKDLVKGAEQRLVQELDSIRRERHSQSLVLANLQAIQNNLERSDFETKSRLSRQIETLERTTTLLNRRLETEERQHKTEIQHLEKQVQTLRQQVDLELSQHQQTKDKLTEATMASEELKLQLKVAESTLATAESRLATITPEEEKDDSEQVKYLNSLLEEHKAKIQSLQSQIQKSREHAEEYKNQADTIQQSLVEHSEATKRLQEDLEAKVKEFSEERQRLLERVEMLEKERQDMLNENIKITEQNHQNMAELRKQLASLQHEIQEAVERRESAISREQLAQQQCEEQSKIAAESQDRYQREVMLHAATMESLTTVKKKLDNFSEQMLKVQEEAKKSEQLLQENEASWNNQRRIMEEDKQRMDSRLKELTEQNSYLHNQLHKMSAQVVSIQERATASVSAGLSLEDSAKTSEQLLEVVKFLRREKEIAESKLEVVQTEANRLQQKAELVEKHLEEANKIIAEERERSQVSIQTAAQHADLMRKVESINLLTDSNRLLRSERERLHQQLMEAEAKVRKLEEDITPLHNNIRELQALLDNLTAEKNTLKGEAERWKTRTNHLIEQSNKTDPEERKKLIQEREEFRTKFTSAIDDLNKSRTECTRLSGEVRRLQNEMTRVNGEKTKIQNDIARFNVDKIKMQQDFNKLTADKTKLEAEKAELAVELEKKNQDIEDKSKTINQLKRIGRKYKEQAEQTNKELEDLKNKVAQAEVEQAKVQQSSGVASVEQIRELEQKLQESESSQEQLKQKAEVAEKKLQELQDKIDSVQVGFKEEKEEMLKEVEKLKQDKVELEHTAAKLREELAELEKKQSQSKAVLQTARTKITMMKDQIEKLTAENNELKDKNADLQETLSSKQKSSEETESRINAIKSPYEAQISQLEHELSKARESAEELRKNIEKLQKENGELQAKIQQLQVPKLGSSQPPVHVSRPAAVAPPERASVPPPEAPKTANIKPITSSPAAIKPQTAPIQPAIAAAKATASIRPMAIASTTVSPLAVSMTTPTATVMPTTVSLQDVTEGGESSSSPAQQLFPASGTSRPTQQVQRVTPQSDSVSQDSEAVQDSTANTADTVTMEPQPSSSVLTVPPSREALGTKRQRDDTESLEEEISQKRTRVSETVAAAVTTQQGPEIKRRTEAIEDIGDEENTLGLGQDAVETVDQGNSEFEAEYGGVLELQEDSSEITHHGDVLSEHSQESTDQFTLEEHSTIPSITVTNEDSVTVTFQPLQSEASRTSQDSVETQETPLESVSQEPVVKSVSSTSTHPGIEIHEDEGDEEVIIVGSDGEEEEGEYADEGEDNDIYTEVMEDYEDEEEEDGNEEEEEDEAREEGEVDIQDEEYQEISGDMEEENGDDQMQTGEQEEDDDDDDVVIVDDNEAQMEAQETDTTPTSQILLPTPPPTLMGQHQGIPIQLERQMSVVRSQLTPFLIGPQPTGFEDLDDCTVPSTPTLFIPRRGDGFAEAVSSPHVMQRFTFGAGNEPHSNQLNLAQLESQGGMDDTRMDLSQLEEGTGRSVPSTPLATTAPVSIPISEPLDVMVSQSHTVVSPSEALEGDPTHVSLEGEPETGESQQDESSEQQQQLEAENSVREQELSGEQGAESAGLEQETGETTATEEKSEGAAEKSYGDQGTQKEESDGSSTSQQDKQDAAGKPKIQPIVWESSALSPGMPHQSHSHAPFQNQGQRIMPMMGRNLARGSYLRGHGPIPPRRPMRGNRGGMYRRPPMY
ncbi:hypothetical protein CHS0354_025782 [Potamilus streckersoni]|uniref:Nucleoprotein TPR n=1 Tax=Potamilus streckersoni TaxID=2493646 RepID=A0AAE0WAY7_9BIVA|nr:hypothetical protein CHS0354_025782 [Potamilus streckersoni]